ncbi:MULTISPECIES: hypothetical protein [Planktothrix]|jgi:hypothetical protein|uniref:Uncharacterized protein n=3 Tax=Planktothrix TaxID=54304 RepID=A0A1J1JIG8_PLAAG|nr:MULTISPECIES: hypothetical protein [Planktothrix]MCF3606326.1 hypothetical protein [Planktothrix agardhii 1033]CAD5922886.1 hypothetical protein NO108_01157 [Planktothrix rubescens]BBD54449.1 hypothetical protein NIES204_17420 [Planktothrix agardhii NIES-204]MBG0748818.1 hypothetical protein [Planktothrix agardhii KL2]MCB8752632.1 hypothetical protein [Planktothrix agardhii 1810]
MLEKLLLAAFITLSLHLQVSLNWFGYKPLFSMGVASQMQMEKIVLSQDVIK